MTAVIAEHGTNDEAAEACLDALLALYPESGPVVTQNTDTGCLSLTIGMDATDPWAASNIGARILTESLNEARLPVVPIVDVHVSVVDHEESVEDVRELAGV